MIWVFFFLNKNTSGPDDIIPNDLETYLFITHLLFWVSNPKADEMDSDFTSVHLHHTKAMADAEKRTGSCRFDFMPCLQV